MSGEGSNSGGWKRNSRVPTKKSERKQVDMDSDDSDNGTLTNNNFDETLYQQPVETDENRLQDPDVDEFVNNTKEWLRRNEHAITVQLLRDFQSYGSLTRPPNNTSGDWSKCRRLMKLLVLLAFMAVVVFFICMVVYFAVKYYEI